jgi:hypothetical protein
VRDVRNCREYFKQPSLANRVNASGVFAKTAAKDLTGCRNIGWPLAARNSSYYSTNIADRKESLRTEWRRRYPDGSCNFDLNGRHAVRRSKCHRALGRLGSAERLRQARRGPPEAELSRPLLSCQGRPRCETVIVHPSRRIGSPSSRIYRECRNPYIPAMFQRMRTRPNSCFARVVASGMSNMPKGTVTRCLRPSATLVWRASFQNA